MGLILGKWGDFQSAFEGKMPWNRSKKGHFGRKSVSGVFTMGAISGKSAQMPVRAALMGRGPA